LEGAFFGTNRTARFACASATRNDRRALTDGGQIPAAAVYSIGHFIHEDMQLMRSSFLGIAICLAVAAISAAPAQAVTVPFTEDFTSNSSNWVNFNSTQFLTYNATGGPDGGSYASGTAQFLGSPADNLKILLRGRDQFNASGGNFNGDWITAGANKVSVWVRHNAPVPVVYAIRAAHGLADPNDPNSLPSFPGATAVQLFTTLPNQWTKLTFDFLPTSPQYDPDPNQAFEGTSWGSVFSGIGQIQIGIRVPASLASDQTNPAYKFDIDKVSLSVPEPATIVSAVVGLVGAAVVVSRRRGRRARG
jgi:hypothetical protein